MKFETPIDLLREASKKIVFPLFRDPSVNNQPNLTEALRNGTVGMGILPKNLDVAVESIREEEDQRILNAVTDALEGDDG